MVGSPGCCCITKEKTFSKDLRLIIMIIPHVLLWVEFYPPKDMPKNLRMCPDLEIRSLQIQ